jgi:hypothetical protein
LEARARVAAALSEYLKGKAYSEQREIGLGIVLKLGILK